MIKSILIFVLLVSGLAKAQFFDESFSTSGKTFLFELGAGYGSGGIEGRDDNVFKADTSGTFFGARIGAMKNSFAFGFDFLFGSSKYIPKETHTSSFRSSPSGIDGVTTTTATTFSDIDALNLGLFVGYDIPWGLRFFFTYIMKAQGELTSEVDIVFDPDPPIPGTSSTTGTLKSKLEGSGFKFGMGYKPIDFISLNLEYQMITWDKLTYSVTETGANEGQTIKSDLADAKTNSLAFTITFPFAL